MVRAGASPRKFCPRHESGARTTETVTEPYLGRPPTLRADSSGAIRRRTDLQASLMHVHTDIARRTMILSFVWAKSGNRYGNGSDRRLLGDRFQYSYVNQTRAVDLHVGRWGCVFKCSGKVGDRH